MMRCAALPAGTFSRLGSVGQRGDGGPEQQAIATLEETGAIDTRREGGPRLRGSLPRARSGRMMQLSDQRDRFGSMSIWHARQNLCETGREKQCAAS